LIPFGASKNPRESAGFFYGVLILLRSKTRCREARTCDEMIFVLPGRVKKKRPPFLEAFGIIWYKLRAV